MRTRRPHAASDISAPPVASISGPMKVDGGRMWFQTPSEETETVIFCIWLLPDDPVVTSSGYDYFLRNKNLPEQTAESWRRISDQPLMHLICSFLIKMELPRPLNPSLFSFSPFHFFACFRCGCKSALCAAGPCEKVANFIILFCRWTHSTSISMSDNLNGWNVIYKDGGREE